MHRRRRSSRVSAVRARRRRAGIFCPVFMLHIRCLRLTLHMPLSDIGCGGGWFVGGRAVGKRRVGGVV
eukprot:3936267-Rhodomonas_salina.3